MKTMAELKLLPIWVGYLSNKVPMDANTGNAAASNNPSTWSNAAEAWAAKKRYGWAGIGCMFSIQTGVVGIDLDDCFTGEGRLNDTARQIVQMMNSYTERSPSGKGLHILACGSIPHSVKRPGFEMYNELRYFTVTGNQYGASEFVGCNIEDRQDEMNALFVVYDGDYEPAPRPVRPAIERGDVSVSIVEVERALGVLPPQGDYNTDWLPILMAVHDAFPDERGIALIERWSPGYKGEVARKWRSFETAERGNRITIASLFHRAKQYGYEPPRSARAAPNAGRRGADITDALTQRRRTNGYAV